MLKLSVIIPVYNGEKYIEKCIESIENQNISDFEIIAIDDGSTDRSLEILEKLKGKYNNLFIISNENNGVSVTRNIGIELSRGEYITFIDSDDIVCNKTFKTIYKNLKENNGDIFIGNIICFNDLKEWHLPYMKKVFNKPEITNIYQDKSLIYTPSVCNKWFKREIIIENNIRFNEHLKVGEDLLFTQEAYKHSKQIIKKDVDIYRYRVINKPSLSKDSSINFFKELVLLQKNIYELYKDHEEIYCEVLHRQMIFLIDSIFLKKDKFLIYDDLYKLAEFALEFYTNNKCFIKEIKEIDYTNYDKYFLSLLLKDGIIENIVKFLMIINSRDRVKNIIIENGEYYNSLYSVFKEYKNELKCMPTIINKIENIKYEKGIIKLYGYAFVRGIENKQNVSKRLVLEGKDITIIKEIKNDLRTDLSYLFRKDNIKYDFGGYKEIEINLNKLIKYDEEFKAYIEIDVDGNIFREKLSCKIAEKKNILKVKYFNFKKIKKEVFCKFDDAQYLNIRIRSLNKKDYIKSRIRSIRRDLRYDYRLFKNRKYKSFITLYLYKIIGWYIRKKNIWLMGERKDMAQDNTYHLYKYIKENNINVKAKYVIEKGCNDIKYIEKYGETINFGSIKHTLYLLCCSVSINSYVERPNMYTKEYLDIIKYYPEYEKRKKVFLQHGVIGVSRVNHVLHKNKVDYDVFVVSSEREKYHIIKEYGYKENEVIVTGLARWDNLKKENINEDKILLMPTWRSWIKSEDELLESEYFNKYIDLLKDKEFIEYLEKTKKTVTFYPHYQTRKLLKGMNIKFNNRINIIENDEYTVQELINSHGILITDYSTVAFDFIYTEKLVIFYQFDYKEFYSKHYNNGIIEHRSELFGVRTECKKEIVKSLKGEIKDNNKYNKFYITLKDDHSGEIIKEIININ